MGIPTETINPNLIDLLPTYDQPTLFYQGTFHSISVPPLTIDSTKEEDTFYRLILISYETNRLSHFLPLRQKALNDQFPSYKFLGGFLKVLLI